MPTTRKKVIKTVYVDENDSEAERAAGDFSDSGSDAHISEQSSSEDDPTSDASSAAEFRNKSKKIRLPRSRPGKTKFAKEFIGKINKQMSVQPADDNEGDSLQPTVITVNDLTDADKLLPSFLNLSESDSSEDESREVPTKKNPTPVPYIDSDNEKATVQEFKNLWSQNIPDNSEEIAMKTFMELERHKTKIEETKASLINYSARTSSTTEVDVKDLLALGEEVLPEQSPVKKGKKKRRVKDDSDSEIEDWEEVKDSKGIPQQGLQLVVDIPDSVCRKTKKLDVEMMMKRRINRVKKEHQVFMHKVHILCWLGHGNYVSGVLNDQEILGAALSLVPSKECYPGERVDMKYVEQITTWFKDKLTLKDNKQVNKFRPKAPPLKDIILGQIKSKVVTNKKYLVFIFVSMLRALGLQCRIMFNFVAVPLKPPSTELCSLSAKQKTREENKSVPKEKGKGKKNSTNTTKSKAKISQIDGNNDSFSSDTDHDTILQLDGSDDTSTANIRSTRSTRANKHIASKTNETEDVSPPKRACKSLSVKQLIKDKQDIVTLKRKRNNVKNDISESDSSNLTQPKESKVNEQKELSLRVFQTGRRKKPNDKESESTHSNAKLSNKINKEPISAESKLKLKTPKIFVTDEENKKEVSSKFFEDTIKSNTPKRNKLNLSRNRSHTISPSTAKIANKDTIQSTKPKPRTKSESGKVSEKSKYFCTYESKPKATSNSKQTESLEDEQRISHRGLLAKKNNATPDNDVKGDLIDIIKNRVREAWEDTVKRKCKGKTVKENNYDSDFLPEEAPKHRNSDSEGDFKPTKISPKPCTSRKIDRRVLSSDDDMSNNKVDVWCEVYVEELEQWISVEVFKAKVHCSNEIYNKATQPVCYVVGWDNNNYLKDLTRRYVPHWNTVTRKQRADPAWWDTAVRPWLGPKNARDREEDEQLNRMQLEAPLPKSIAEYKNHPLYALKRHLLKFEAIYPPDAATLGFVRGEPVYARECVYVCRSRDTWLKEAKVVKLGEQPYKVVKARPKWDKLSNKLITDKPLEVFGPWQVQEYEPPVAENGVVPRNAYGNVELFKDCMLPKGTVHIKLPSLNRVAKKLNIDCAPAMTGFDFNGGWSHPVYDGFVVCKEYEEVITEAWLKDQEEQERKEREKIELRVYGNWKRLIKGLLIKERLKKKYGFNDPSTSQAKKPKKGPRVICKKR